MAWSWVALSAQGISGGWRWLDAVATNGDGLRSTERDSEPRTSDESDDRQRFFLFSVAIADNGSEAMWLWL
ncbi:hypothetical protein F0562_021390 [Nyssa sinensis]|uniref:Uncharacterized protein n=1 Tax=Nyssa sinensis TaxID=561372 RepID=A0A5J5BJ14_9ASTE|nr:hypothetical protein F0562_021390 [Nyssa sinensis]